MASGSDSALTRYRPAILLVTALALGWTFYHLHRSQSHNEASQNAQLRRRNAVHRARHHPRRDRTAPTRQHSSQTGRTVNATDLLRAYRDGSASYGQCRIPFTTNEGTTGSRSIFMSPLGPEGFANVEALHQFCDPAELDNVRRAFEENLMSAILNDRVPPTDQPPDPESIFNLFQAEGFTSLEAVSAATQGFISGHFDDSSSRIDGGEQPRALRLPHSRATQTQDPTIGLQAQSGNEESQILNMTAEVEALADVAMQETMMDGESEHSWRGEEDSEEPKKEGQSLLNMLYHIAEDQSRREGYIHRGVSCNSCNAHPIKGIRYRCANCVDYDLCETCEALQIHPKTHLFYKIRIPAPYLGNPRQPQPVWYPGKPAGLPNNLSREQGRNFSNQSGFDTPEVDALWDQFKCLAAVEWPEDPHGFCMAIDRDTFDRCFMPTTSNIRSPPTLLIYDRMFTFYDTNLDGLIGFEEFLIGLSIMRSKNQDEKVKRIFHGYDHDRDGFVSRKDFLLMFRAFYALTREFTHDMVAGMEEDLLEGSNLRDNITGTHPISAVYTGAIPYAERSRTGQGKASDRFGDQVIVDGGEAISTENPDESDHNQLIGDISEIAAFGNVVSTENGAWYTELGEIREDMLSRATREAIEAGHQATPISPSASEALQRNDYPVAKFENWPPDYVTDGDVQRALGRDVSAYNVFTHDDRNKILLGASIRLKAERENPKKRIEARNAGIEERKRRQQFYLQNDEETNLLRNDPDTSSNQSISKVSDVKHLDSWKGPTDGERTSRPLSSQPENFQRFPPPLDKDVSREVLYQITQEGLNELLDPLFKQREDLAIEVNRTASERKKLREQLFQFKTDKMLDLCRIQVRRAQAEWRRNDEGVAANLDVGWELRKMIARQEDYTEHDHARNLEDMKDVGMFDSSTYVKKLKQLASRLKEEAERTSPKSLAANRRQDSIIGGQTGEDKFHAISSRDIKEPQTHQTPHANPTSSIAARELSNNSEAAFPATTSRTESNEAPVQPSEATSSTDNDACDSPDDDVLKAEIKEILESAGYTVVDESSEPTESRPDPTLPQNRPNSISEISSPTPPTPSSSHEDAGDAKGGPATPLHQKLKYMTMLEVIREEDDKERGGPGRLSFGEFEEILKGPKGSRLSFLGSWIELVNF